MYLPGETGNGSVPGLITPNSSSASSQNHSVQDWLQDPSQSLQYKLARQPQPSVSSGSARKQRRLKAGQTVDDFDKGFGTKK